MLPLFSSMSVKAVSAFSASVCHVDRLDPPVGVTTDEALLAKSILELEGLYLDLSLHASLPYGSTTSMPEPPVFGAWTAAIVGRIVAVLGGHGDVAVHATATPTAPCPSSRRVDYGTQRSARHGLLRDSIR